MATQNVVEAVTEVHAGRYYLCPSVAHFVVEAGLSGRRSSRQRGAVRVGLTGQERKVLQLVAEGHSNKEIADVLGLAVNTVHAHRNAVMAKLDKAATGIRPDVLKRYGAIRMRRGLAVTTVRNGTCQGCNMNVPPQLYNTLQRGNTLETCPYCHRIVYWEDLMKPDPPSTPPAE